MDVIEFKLPSDDGSPRLKRVRAGAKTEDGRSLFCMHGFKLLIDEDTQLVTCERCGTQMSAFNALMVITKQWERMHYESLEYRAAQEQKAKIQKESRVQDLRRKLQWVECPDEGEEPARSLWVRYVEASGEQPWAMFKRGNSKRYQYCFATPTGGYIDAEFAIRAAKPKQQAALETA